MQHRPTLPLLGALLLAACSTTSAPRTATNEDNADYVSELLAASTRKPAAPERIGERRATRVRSRGLADVDLPPVAVELATWSEDEQGLSSAQRPARLALVRFRDVVHLTSPHGGDEWLFHRNRVATDEVSGERVDHGSRYVIDYTDGELASENVLDGWARLAQLFVAPEELDALAPTGERTTYAGHAFERLARTDAAPVGALVEVEWSAELGLPRRVVWQAAHGTRVQELTALREASDADRPAAFAARWPEYDRKDLSDWREDIHDHAGDGHDHATH